MWLGRCCKIRFLARFDTVGFLRGRIFLRWAPGFVNWWILVAFCANHSLFLLQLTKQMRSSHPFVLLPINFLKTFVLSSTTNDWSDEIHSLIKFTHIRCEGLFGLPLINYCRLIHSIVSITMQRRSIILLRMLNHMVLKICEIDLNFWLVIITFLGFRHFLSNIHSLSFRSLSGNFIARLKFDHNFLILLTVTHVWLCKSNRHAGIEADIYKGLLRDRNWISWFLVTLFLWKLIHIY